MQSSNSSLASDTALPLPKSSNASNSTQCFMTPPKKTQARNLSPGKKPVMQLQAAAKAPEVAITPFNLLLAFES